MENDANNPTPTPPAGNPPVVNPPKDEKEYLKMAEDLGQYRKKAEDFDEFQKRVNPVLETLLSDPELYKEVVRKHNKRLGIAVDDDKSNDGKDDKGNPATPTPPNPKNDDTREALVNSITADFEKEFGLDKLAEDVRKEVNSKVIGELKDILDPNDNKTVVQVLQDVSLKKLRHYLEKAYYLATKDDQIKAAVEAGKAEALGEGTGIIGTMPSGSTTTQQTGLSAKEKEIARKMGVTEEKYLENKKKILERNSKSY